MTFLSPTEPRRTSLRRIPRPRGDVWQAEVVGRLGRGVFVRRSFELAQATAREYAVRFDAPNEVF